MVSLGKNSSDRLNQELIDSTFLNSYKEGANPSLLREKIIGQFMPFFTNVAFLEQHAWFWLIEESNIN